MDELCAKTQKFPVGFILTESHLFFILKTVLGRSLDPRLLGKIP